MKKIKATVHFTNENNFPRQFTFEARSEEELFEKVFLFETETFKEPRIKQLCYENKVIDWQKVYTGIHYWLGEGHYESFGEFKEKWLEIPEKIAV